jgi:hypothetical protein
MRISILQGTATGSSVYTETQSPTTNNNGLIAIEIGTGNIVSGNFANIDWANGPFFVKTETDPNGGTNYTLTGTSQLLSVPYALYAKNGLPSGSQHGQTLMNCDGDIVWTFNGQCPAKIAAFNCADTVHSGILYVNSMSATPYCSTSTTCFYSNITYSGGNGGFYAAQSIASIGVLGLTAELAGGNLNIQSTNGNVNFSGVTTALSATTSITLTSVGTFNINSGSSNLLITSNQFSLGANSAFFNVPVTVSGAFGGNSMYSFSNTSTGGGLYVNLIGTTSTSRFLANFLVSGTSKFYVRSDGKVKFDKTNFAYSTYTATTPTYAISTKNYYIIGSNVLTNGNRVVVNLTAGVLGIGIAIPLNSGSTGLSDYIAVGESISMSIFSSSSTSAGWISGISYSTNGTSSAGYADFTATPVVNVTVLKTGTSSFLIYYDTTSVSGIFTV